MSVIKNFTNDTRGEMGKTVKFSPEPLSEEFLMANVANLAWELKACRQLLTVQSYMGKGECDEYSMPKTKYYI